jgi:hypothetical protein
MHGKLIRAALLALVVTAGACKKSGDALLVVRVTSAQSLTDVTRLDVTR